MTATPRMRIYCYVIVSGALIVISSIACSPLIYNPVIYTYILLTVFRHIRDFIAVVTEYIWVMKH